MNLAAYKLLKEEEQFELLESQGVFLAEREDAYHNIRLYAIHGFYAEVYSHTHFNVIVRTRCFATTRFLEPYLKKMDLDGLFR
jgi:hypothetical protein